MSIRFVAFVAVKTRRIRNFASRHFGYVRQRPLVVPDPVGTIPVISCQEPKSRDTKTKTTQKSTFLLLQLTYSDPLRNDSRSSCRYLNADLKFLEVLKLLDLSTSNLKRIEKLQLSRMEAQNNSWQTFTHHFLCCFRRN